MSDGKISFVFRELCICTTDVQFQWGKEINLFNVGVRKKCGKISGSSLDPVVLYPRVPWCTIEVGHCRAQLVINFSVHFCLHFACDGLALGITSFMTVSQFQGCPYILSTGVGKIFTINREWF